MDAAIKYLTGPVVLTTLSGIVVCIVTFYGSDFEKSKIIPWITMLCGVAVIGSGIWSGIRALGDQTNVSRAVGPKIYHIIDISKQQISMMAVDARVQLQDHNKTPSDETLRKIFSKLSPDGKSPVISVNEGYQLNWLEFMYQEVLKTQKEIFSANQFMPFLDFKLIKLLGDLEDCYHFKEIELTANGAKPGNKTLEYAAGPFLQYIKIVRAIEIYFDENLAKHTSKTPAHAVQPVVGK